KQLGSFGHEGTTMRARSPQTAAGRRERFERIYRANYEPILGYARRRTGPDEAADVLAETFLVAWRRLDTVPDGHEARLWLYGTARTPAADALLEKIVATEVRERSRGGRAPRLLLAGAAAALVAGALVFAFAGTNREQTASAATALRHAGAIALEQPPVVLQPG